MFAHFQSNLMARDESAKWKLVSFTIYSLKAQLQCACPTDHKVSPGTSVLGLKSFIFVLMFILNKGGNMYNKEGGGGGAEIKEQE
jgi:hypothetical protein